MTNCEWCDSGFRKDGDMHVANGKPVGRCTNQPTATDQLVADAHLRITELKATNGVLVDALHDIHALLLMGDSHSKALARARVATALAYAEKHP